MIPIRRLLLRDLLILAAGMLALIVGASWHEQQRVLGLQADARAAESLAHLDQRLGADLEGAQALGRHLQTWWSRGVLGPDDPDVAAHLLTPLLASQRAISSVNLCRSDGRSLLFLKLGESWSLRELKISATTSQVRWRRLNPDGQVLRVEAWTPMAYDPRTRPWYVQGAAASSGSWTGAYTFYTTRDPGITFTLPVHDATARLAGVVALDFLLDDLTRHVWDAQPTPHSRALVVDAQGHALILPRDNSFTSAEARRQAFMQPLGPGALGPFRPLLEQRSQGGVLRYGSDGATWIGRVHVFDSHPGLHWRLVLAIPEEDLLGSPLRRNSGMLLLALLTLGLAIWRIRRLARQVATPLANLEAVADALGIQATLPDLDTPIREIRSLERALRQAQEGLAAQSRLQRQLEHSQRMETVGTLAGGIAHDVNNQLAAILGQIHLCRELLPEDHPVLRRLERAEEATRRCAQTTKALLSFSHQSRPELRQLDLNAVVQETSSVLEPLLGGRIRLQLHLSPGLPPVAGDAVQLEQVLMNLGVNARDAMPEGGSLGLSTSLEGDGRVLLQAVDTGTGIPEAVLPRIFEPFVTTKSLGKGTGLGLAMVFSIVKAHQGEIKADNLPGSGARFRIWLPPATRLTLRTTAPEASLRSAAPNLAGRRILLVEDEPMLREMLADALTLARMQVTTAPDGALAWKAWQQQPHPPDLVISDQRMPDCTGLELMALIRDSGSDVPFILISGQGLEAVEADLAHDRRVRILAKPFELTRLLPVMEDLLDATH